MIVLGSNNNMSRTRQNNQGYENRGSNFRNRESFKSTYCGEDYHREATCYKKNGYLPGHPRYRPCNQHQGSNNKFSVTPGNTPSDNHVDSSPTFKELQSTMPNLTEVQYIQILVALNPKLVTPQANATSPSASDFASGFGYEDDDWCG
ncbi:uncharacterized protein LOC133742987 [Rosa rugosa]|uniref:uncharacterized protein LOC133742987 n=1 Tax=Rosa rugosa TaxID=74645 RepID=UPI002B4048A7|nr:uncharacterized protein LOC133742987 [Rosa rugosa]